MYRCAESFDRLAAGHGEWSDYSLESTARVLACKFPEHAVWVVLPKAHVHGALASYDNFARTDWELGGAVPECECGIRCGGNCGLGRVSILLALVVYSALWYSRASQNPCESC